MDQIFLKEVQAAGWMIRKVTESAAVVSCPNQGCTLHVNLELGKHIPKVNMPCRIGKPIEDFDDIRCRLRDRRQELGLSIKDVEEIGGFAYDHLPKFEKDDPYRIPNMQTTIDWANALGNRLVFKRREVEGWHWTEFDFSFFNFETPKESNAAHIIKVLKGSGFDMFLRPGELPGRAIRIICETRDKIKRRARRFEIEAQRREKLG